MRAVTLSDSVMRLILVIRLGLNFVYKRSWRRILAGLRSKAAWQWGNLPGRFFRLPQRATRKEPQ